MLLVEQLQAFSDYVHTCANAGCRAVVKIAGSTLYTQQILGQLVNVLEHKQMVILPNVHSVATVNHQLQQLLGTEVDVLVIDAYQGFNPNLLGAVTGCVRAGGVCIILVPEHWQAFADPDYVRMTTSTKTISGRFIQHVEAVFNSLPDSLCIQQTSPVFSLKKREAWPVFTPCYEEQKTLITAIKKTARGRARRPLVIQSDRGCGKSAALGIAAAELLLAKDCHIIVTASQFSSLATLFRHASNVCAIDWHQQKKLKINNSVLEFIPIDQLLDNTHADFIMVDEAASIPTPVLRQITMAFPRIVFATTVHGYEGNGRGFSLRFMPFLEQIMPHFQLMKLSSPLRYAKHDSLALWANRALLLSSWHITEQCVAETPWLTKIDRRDLVNNEERLQQIFGLLIEAHYQTSADDVRLLLDHPDVDIYVLEHTQHIIAVAVVMQEGAISAQQQAELAQGARRLRGHLLPQALALGFDEVLSLRFTRVVRIAVQNVYRRQGFAKQLLTAIEETLDADFFGASFSAEESLLAFWHSLDMHVVRLGYQRESASGEYACMMVKPLNPLAETLLKRLHTAYTKNIEYRLLAKTLLCSPALILLLLRDCSFVVDDNDNIKARFYLQQRCSFEVVEDAIYRCVLSYHGALNSDIKEHCLVISKLLLNQSWEEVAKYYQYSGRAESEVAMRSVLTKLLDL